MISTLAQDSRCGRKLGTQLTALLSGQYLRYTKTRTEEVTERGYIKIWSKNLITV